MLLSYPFYVLLTNSNFINLTLLYKLMPQQEGSFVSETGNWNVASDYAKVKIMKPLWLADEYELISLFGTADFIEELNLTIPPDVLKIRGFRRLVNCLLMLINNSYFAVKKDRGRDDLEKYQEELKRINKIIPVLCKTQINQLKKTNQLVLNKEIYEKVLERVLEIKALINEPLNKNHLIFTDKKEFDPRAFKEGIKKRIIGQG